MRKKIFLCLITVMTFLSLTFSCKQTQSNSDGSLIVRFNEHIKVLRSNSSLVNTGGAVSEGEELIFSSYDLEAGQFVSSWSINGVELENSAQGKFFYSVKSSDAKMEGSLSVLEIAFSATSLSSSEGLIVKFADDVSCKETFSSVRVLSGSKVAGGEKLDFNAVLQEDEACENWYINDVKTPISSPLFQYVVSKEDAKIEDDKAVINVSFIKAITRRMVIRFDDSKIGAIDQNQKRIFNNDEVSSSDILTFTANIEAGKTVDSWFVGNTKQENQTSRTFVYSPAEKDVVKEGGKKIITIKCEKRNPGKVKINFNKDEIYTLSGIESGTLLDEGTFIVFNSKFTNNSHAPTWYLNDKKQPAQSLGGDLWYDSFIQTFKYTVDIKDAVDEGNVKVINVSYKVPNKNKKLTLTFDDSVVVVAPGVGQVQSGHQFESGETLGVQANYGVEGEDSPQTVAFEAWFLNGKRTGFPKIAINPTIYQTNGSSFAYFYRISEEDADENGNINISYTTHERKSISIEFDSSIEAYKGSATARTRIESGTVIKEDTFLSFRKEPSIGEYFDENFYFNGKKWEFILSSDLYLLNSNDAVEKDGILVLEVTTKTRPEQEIKIVWNDSNMTCQNHSGSVNFSSGDSVSEGKSLVFKYNLTDNTKIIRGFFTDGKDDSHILARNGDTDKIEGCIVKADLKYCVKEGGEYVLRPRFQIEDKQMVTIMFDSSLECRNRDSSGSIVTNGMKIPEGTTLGLKANIPQVYTWIVGMKEIHGGRLTLPNPAIWCVNKEWAKKENGEYVARISFK